jgi:hypothetical protein
MSTAATKATTTKKKSNYATSYFKTRPKQLIVWIPPDINQESAIYSTAILLINTNEVGGKNYRISEIPCGDYDNDFNNFYAFHLKQYTDVKSKRAKYHFCWSNSITGGVSQGYMINEANNPKNVTIMAVDMDESKNIIDVFALLTFSISVSKNSIHVHTLCSNNDPNVKKSGEGNKLLKFIQSFGLIAEIHNTSLNPIAPAVKFYEQMGYRNERKGDDKETPPSSSSSNSSSWDDASSSSPELVMQRNNQTKRLFAKLRNSIHATFGLALRQSKRREKLELQDRHKQLAKDALADVVPTKKQGTLIPAPFTTRKVKLSNNKINHTMRNNILKLPSEAIVPGKSLRPAAARVKYDDMSKSAHRLANEI